VFDQPWVGIENVVDGFKAEDRLGDKQLVRHVHVLPVQWMALRHLEDQVRGHQAWRDRPAREVVDRLGTVRERMQQAEHVDRHVSEMAVPVVDYQVEVDVV